MHLTGSLHYKAVVQKTKHPIPDNIDKVVVFPAPFVPKKPKHSPS